MKMIVETDVNGF